MTYNAYAINENDKSRWNSLLYNSIFPSYRQTFSYEYIKRLNNRQVFTYIFTSKGEDVAGVHYSIKRSKLNLIIVADILSGILFKRQFNEDLLEFIVNHFLDFAESKSASFLRITPWIPSSINRDSTGYQALLERVLFKHDFETIKEGRHTYWIDLSISEDELLGNMKRQTRYDVRQGLKSEITITEHKTNNTERNNDFWRKYRDIGAKKKFTMIPELKFKSEVSTLLENKEAILYIASCKGININYSLASNFGIASYLHGAIDPDYKKIPGCPSPGHLVQWEMIKSLKSIGVHYYDMGFCPGPVPQKDHHAYYIWRFKYGFGGMHVSFLPTYGRKLSSLKGKIFQYLNR